MFQIEKPDVLHERTDALFTKTEVSALQITARKPLFTVNFTKRGMSGNSRINHLFCDVGKRSVNSAFSLCECQENMGLIRCFPALDKRR